MKLTQLITLTQKKNALAGMQRGSLLNFTLMNSLDWNSFSTISRLFLISILFLFTNKNVFSQNCPVSGNSVIVTNPNTYYPGNQAVINTGATSINLGAVPAGYGSTPIASGDILMIIQTQGVQINSTNTSSYGSGVAGGGSGFTTTNLQAGNMEFVIANNAVPLTGGALNLLAGTVKSYSKAAYGATGQYTYQVIRVNPFFNVQCGATITTPLWDGSVGGITIIEAVNQIDFNGKTINASGAGFRGGAGRKLSGAAGTSKFDYVTLATTAANGSKGEGIAGTPRYLNNNGVLLDNIVEGYPGGSYARGAPGNAGGGATDSDPTSNDQNSGGAGGGNVGAGGGGGWGWFSAGTTGGKGGSSYNTLSPYTTYYTPSAMILGGGGGSGTSNDGTGVPAGGFASSGAAGGGMVIINAASLIGTGTINVSGAAANSTCQIDGSGGGGAGGSALLYAASGLSNITVNANGGNGGSNNPSAVSATQHGPGGGGGGGAIYANALLNGASSANGGSAGISTSSAFSNNFGAINGFNGGLTQNITLSLLPPNMTKCQGSIVLPVKLDNFSASYTNSSNVLVSWTVSNEMNASHYEVERSEDGINFSDIGNVNAGLSSNAEHDYTFNDYLASIHSSLVYYRLKMVEISGNFTYSKIIPLRLDQAQSETKISIYPNPATDFAVLKLYSGKQDVAIVKLMDNAGKEIMKKSYAINIGSNNLLIDRLNSLPKGLYIIEVISGNTFSNEKLIKQ